MVRVASYNLRDFKDDVTAAARVVRAIAPDVLLAQEAPRHPFSGHRVADFAAACGLFWPGDHRGSGGTTVLTSLRMHVSHAAHHGLRVPRFERERGYAVTHLALPGHQRFAAVSAHLGLDADQRVAHAKALLGRLPERLPLVIGGDLNEEPTGPAWQLLERRLSVLTGDTATFPARAPDRRIDAIFASPSLVPVSSEVDVRVAPVLSSDDLLAATDHLPVWADVDLSALAPPVRDRPISGS